VPEPKSILRRSLLTIRAIISSLLVCGLRQYVCEDRIIDENGSDFATCCLFQGAQSSCPPFGTYFQLSSTTICLRSTSSHPLLLTLPSASGYPPLQSPTSAKVPAMCLVSMHIGTYLSSSHLPIAPYPPHLQASAHTSQRFLE
jgi:hypothetical protein